MPVEVPHRVIGGSAPAEARAAKERWVSLRRKGEAPAGPACLIVVLLLLSNSA